MKKIILYGIGQYIKNHQSLIPTDAEVIGYCNSYFENSTTATGIKLNNKNIYAPNELGGIEFDEIYVCTGPHASFEIFNTLLNNGISINKIKFVEQGLDKGCIWKEYIDNNGVMISEINGIRFRNITKSGNAVIKEIFMYNCYDFYLFHNKKNILIDIGQNEGIASLYFASFDTIDKIYGFEPFPDTFALAKKNFELNKELSNKIVSENCALLDCNKKSVISVYSEQPGWRNIFCTDEEKRKVEITIKDTSEVLKKIIKENEGYNISLKIDTEGSEFKIFESLEKNDLFKYISNIMMEYHADCSMLLNTLTANNFTYYRQGPFNIGTIFAVNLTSTKTQN